MTRFDDRWTSFEITAEFLQTKAEWLRQKRTLHSSSRRYFEVSADLIELSRFNYPLASVAFFHAVPGLEKALRVHYLDDNAKLSVLLKKARNDGFVSEEIFEHSPPFTGFFADRVKRTVGKKKAVTRCETFVELIPELRNQYFHGDYLLAPDYLHMTFQLRRVADRLTTFPRRP